MNYPNWYAFIQMHMKANVFVYKNGSTIDFVSYNKFQNLNKFEKCLRKKSNLAFIDQLEMIKNYSQIDGRQTSIIFNELKSVLSVFQIQTINLVHKNLNIRTQAKESLTFDALPEHVKNTVCSFIELQHSSIKCFISKFHIEEDNKPQQFSEIDFFTFKWDGTKSEFIELTNALYEGDFIKYKNSNLTKKEHFELCAKLFNVNIDNWQVILSKQSTRENSTIFIDKLKKTIGDYYNKIFE